MLGSNHDSSSSGRLLGFRGRLCRVVFVVQLRKSWQGLPDHFYELLVGKRLVGYPLVNDFELHITDEAYRWSLFLPEQAPRFQKSPKCGLVKVGAMLPPVPLEGY